MTDTERLDVLQKLLAFDQPFIKFDRIAGSYQAMSCGRTGYGRDVREAIDVLVEHMHEDISARVLKKMLA